MFIDLYEFFLCEFVLGFVVVVMGMGILIVGLFGFVVELFFRKYCMMIIDLLEYCFIRIDLNVIFNIIVLCYN